MKLCWIRTGFTTGLTASIFYTVFAIGMHFMHDYTIKAFSLLHMINFAIIKPIHLTFKMYSLGVLEMFIVFFVLGTLFALIFNMFTSNHGCCCTEASEKKPQQSCSCFRK